MFDVYTYFQSFDMIKFTRLNNFEGDYRKYNGICYTYLLITKHKIKYDSDLVEYAITINFVTFKRYVIHN